ncbi:ATP-NAD kinase [Alteromonas aestuariivivens]|uniref:ATP-NAD kinase n=1 Tax=Alteromonas aestuariivivens TaxID=1938339 RepID=A0A3D8M4W8_9ALTE|nr:ATP-NAD kinase family protein [Alteromonas aestuariivivens]RDV24620.1 ATP-NAD kinase [Alteromonas aestuariivivens]
MKPARRFRLGVLVNPFAGIGGALALKGSDGAEIREQALALGAKPQANARMGKALSRLVDAAAEFEIFTVAADMGQSICEALGLPCQVVYTPANVQTESSDTEAAVRCLIEAGADLILFAGGDGTARNVCHVVQDRVPVLGVPAGCKIHSGVYTVTPSAAGEVVLKMLSGELVSEYEAEVRDIDEQAFRQGRVVARHYGEMRVPHDLTYVQSVKMGGQESEELVLADICDHVTELMDEMPDTLFVMGSGSTVASVMQELGLENTLLGVDVIRQGQLLAKDVTAEQLLQITDGHDVRLVVTVIGGQGHVFGRGNQQLSAAFLKRLGKDRILVLATKQKLQQLGGRPLRLDTGDSELDKAMAGSFSIITGYHDKVLYTAV